MVLFKSQSQKNKTWMIIGAIIIALIIIITVFFGVRNIFRIIILLIEISLFLAFLGGIAYAFYYIFIKKHRYDVTYVNKKKLIEAGKRNKLANLKGLYVSGDKTHTRVYIGDIIGYCRIQVLAKHTVYEETIDPETGEKQRTMKMIKDEKGQLVPKYELEKEEQDVFIVRKKGLLGYLTEPIVIRVSPEDHDELIGDVTLYGYSLIPISEYWFLNTDYLDVRKIDYAILKEAERGIMFETLRDVKEVVDRAIGLDARHKKDIETKHLVELPELQRISR